MPISEPLPQRAGRGRGTSREEQLDTQQAPPACLGQQQQAIVSTPVAAHTFSMRDANATESLSINSAAAPRPLQNKLSGPGLEGSITAKLARGHTVLREMALLVLNPQQHTGAVYNQGCVINVQNLH